MRDKKIYDTIYDECIYLRRQQFLSFYDGNNDVEHYTSCADRYAALLDITQQLGLDDKRMGKDIEIDMQKYIAAVEKP